MNAYLRVYYILLALVKILLQHGGECSLKYTNDTISQDTEQWKLVLGGYFSVHKRGTTEACGEIDPESGLYLVEAMRYAIRKINAMNSFYGVKLGFRIKDTCTDIALLTDDLKNMILPPGNIVGIVGPATSDEAILASTGVRVFSMPVISYSASSVDLDDRVKYNNFYRTIPADNIQDHVFVDILKYFNWTYISTVNSHGNYGQRGMDGLIAMLAPKGICIATRNVLPQSPKKSDYQDVVKNLNADPKAKVVVLFTTAEDTHGIMTAARSGRRFVWLSSSVWTVDKETVVGIEDVAKGALMLNYAGIDDQEYRKYFMGLKLSTNRYPWFEQFWEKVFNCTLKPSNVSKICTGNESLSDSSFYGKYAASRAVMDAVDAFACAFQRVLYLLCIKPGFPRKLCAQALVISNVRSSVGLRLENEKVSCGFYQGKQFDSKGSFYRDIEVINFDGQSYKTVGVWKLNSTTQEGELMINQSKISWFHDDKKPPVSVCSLPCNPGEITIKSGTKICCSTCKSCGQNGYVFNNTCKQCGNLERPNEKRTFCIKFSALKHSFKNYPVQITLFGSILGIVLNSIVMILFVKHKNSRIVKSSSRELSFVILSGLYLCFISPFIFFFEPSKILCGLRRFIFGMSLTVCYTALVLKTNRIYRIFKAANVMVAMPQLVSPQSQIVICLALLGIQLLLFIMWVIGVPPEVVFIIYNNKVATTCKFDIVTVIINLVPCFCMMFISTFYAFKTRKFPKNYNEASSIGITMYVSCFLWAIFIPLLLSTKTQGMGPFAEVYVITNFSNVVGLVSLLGLFGPKVRRLLFLRKQAISQVFFSSVQKDHSVNNTVDVSFDRSIDGSLENSIEEYLESEKINKRTKERRKTL